MNHKLLPGSLFVASAQQCQIDQTPLKYHRKEVDHKDLISRKSGSSVVGY